MYSANDIVPQSECPGKIKVTGYGSVNGDYEFTGEEFNNKPVWYCGDMKMYIYYHHNFNGDTSWHFYRTIGNDNAVIRGDEGGDCPVNQVYSFYHDLWDTWVEVPDLSVVPQSGLFFISHFLHYH